MKGVLGMGVCHHSRRPGGACLEDRVVRGRAERRERLANRRFAMGDPHLHIVPRHRGPGSGRVGRQSGSPGAVEPGPGLARPQALAHYDLDARYPVLRGGGRVLGQA